MILEKYETKGCCGKTSLFFKLSKCIDTNLVNAFIKNGFVQQQHFIKAGVCYLTNNDFIISGPFNATKLQVKCKTQNCNINLITNILEQL